MVLLYIAWFVGALAGVVIIETTNYTWWVYLVVVLATGIVSGLILLLLDYIGGEG